MHDRCYAVLDALDECRTTGQGTERLNAIELFSELLNTDHFVNIVVSRRSPIFETDKNMNYNRRHPSGH